MSINQLAKLAMRLVLAIGVAGGLAYAEDLQTEVVPANHQKAPKVVTHSSVSLDTDTASSVGHHHYNSDAERARDDLLITQVKSALANQGISEGYPVEVDADHGTVTLSGVVASADQVKMAEKEAASVPGVVTVKNQLQPHRN